MTQVEETVATFDPPKFFYRVMYEETPNVAVEYRISPSTALDLDRVTDTAEWVAREYRVKSWVVKVTTTDD
ncbi:hypothetical protein SEA_CECE_182 [Microbacterium phage Cece]|nr:hypothetical protein SEA_CECE_182 [Microbacterium phage Cece]